MNCEIKENVKAYIIELDKLALSKKEKIKAIKAYINLLNNIYNTDDLWNQIEALELSNQFKPVAVSDEDLNRLKECYEFIDKYYSVSMPIISQSLKEIYSKLTTPVQSDAVEFGEWLRNQRTDIFHGQPTTSELYDLFKQSNNK